MEVEVQEVTTITQVGVLNIFWWSLILVFIKGQGIDNDIFQEDQDSEVVEGDTEVQRLNGMLYLLLNSFPVLCSLEINSFFQVWFANLQ